MEPVQSLSYLKPENSHRLNLHTSFFKKTSLLLTRNTNKQTIYRTQIVHMQRKKQNRHNIFNASRYRITRDLLACNINRHKSGILCLCASLYSLYSETFIKTMIIIMILKRKREKMQSYVSYWKFLLTTDEV